MRRRTGFTMLFLSLLSLNLYPYTNVPLRLQKGETFVYDITAFNIKVAEQKTVIRDITLFSNIEVYHIYTEIKTIPAVSKIYYLHTIIESFIDTRTLEPVLTKTRITEKKGKNQITIYFNRDRERIEYKDLRGEKTLPLKEKVLGLDSLLFYIRQIDPLPNEKVTFFVHNQKEIQKINTVVKLINKKTYVKALKKNVKSIYYKSLNKKDAELWLTHDDLRIPYKFISIKIPVSRYISKTRFISIINTLKYYKKGR